MYTVYMHISPSNKRYIGITGKDNVNQRWQNGNGYKGNAHFYNAIEKYGWNNFKHIIIAKGLSEDEAKWLEIELIKQWDSANQFNGYNISLGGESGYGCVRSKETRKKMSESKKGENNPTKRLEVRNKMSKSHKGKKLSNEHKRNIGNACKGENNGMYGKGYLVTGRNSHQSKSVICLTTKRIFYTITEAAKYYGINKSSDIGQVCKHKRKSRGKLSDGTKLVWRYLVWNHGKTFRLKQK